MASHNGPTLLPVTPLQEGMLFHAVRDERGVDVYTEQLVTEFDGELDAVALRAAFDSVLARHANLRVAFRRTKSGQPVQVVQAGVVTPWREVDLRGAGESEVDRIADDERALRFDTATPPLLRVVLVRAADRRHVLVLTVHHLLIDGWSMPVLFEELIACYTGRELPPVAPYERYLGWWQAQDRGAALSAWRAALAGLDGPTRLLAAGETAALPGVVSTHLSEEDTRRLTAWARSHNLTLNTVTQVCFAVLLGVLTGRDDVVFGGASSGRPAELTGVERMIGLFVTTLPVRVRLDPAVTLLQVLEAVQTEQSALREHQHVGLADVHEQAGRGELFDTVLAFQNAPLDLQALHVPGLRLAGLRARNANHYPLTLVVEAGSELTLRLEHTPGLGRDEVAAYADLLAHLLRSAPDLAGTAVARIDLGGRAEAELRDHLLRPVPAGVPGELRDQAGRLGRRLPDGTIEAVGRVDERGFAVRRIEVALRALPGVRDAAAIVREDAAGKRHVVAYVVSDRQDVDAALPEHLRPSACISLEALPRNEDGELDRTALPDGRDAFPPVRPAGERERLLCEVFADVLGRSAVGPADDFFELGGNSLLAVRLTSRLRTVLGVEVKLRDLFRAPTVTELAAVLDQAAPTRPPLCARSRPERVPLSFAQQRLWFLNRLEGPGATYNMPVVLLLDGRVDVEALRVAVRAVGLRHESLRTVFPDVDGVPYQQVVDVVPELEVVHTHEVGATVATLARQGFDLATEIPLRAHLVIGPYEQFLMLVLHHIVGDEGSLRPLVDDLCTAYTASLRGEDTTLPPLPVQYADYALWQRDLLAGTEQAHLDHWREMLRGLPEEIALPVDRPRPAVPSYRGDVLRTEVPAEVCDGLNRLARKQSVTTFMALQAAVAATLHRLGAGTDVPLGTPVTGRTVEELDGLVGFFANTLVLRTDLTGDPGFTDLLTRVRTANLAAYHHQELPFERLVEVLAPERSRARSPLFQVLIGLHDGSSPEVTVPGLTMTLGHVPTGTAKFDLSFEFTEHDRGLTLELEYATDLFDPRTVQHLGDLVVRLLAEAVRNPKLPLSRLDVLGPSERARLLELGTGPRTGRAEFRVLDRVAAHGAAVALSDETGAEVTYRELYARAGAVAGKLDGRLAGVLAEPGARFAAAVLGAWGTGGAYVPLDVRAPVRRIAELVADNGIELLLVDEKHAGTARSIGVEHIVLDDAMSGEWTPAATAWQDLAYVIFTSGSTGRPKGAMVHHGGMVNHLLAKCEDLSLGPDDVVVLNAPLTFDISVWQLCAAFLVGGRTHVVGRDTAADPDRLFGQIARHGVTVLEVVPSLLRAALESWETCGAAPDLSGLRALLVTGEALPPDLTTRWTRAFPDIPLVNAYGPTECSDDVTHAVIRGPEQRVPIGKPLRNTVLRVLDERLEPVPAGVVGELYVGGDGVGLGYLGDPLRTAVTFTADPLAPGRRMYRTGDRVRWRADGQLEFVERLDHQVKVRGHRIELGEVESALLRVPGVREAAAAVRTDASGHSVLIGYVVGDVPGLAASVAELVPDHLVPSVFVPLPAMPLTSNGKVDRAALPEPPRARQAGRAPATEAERVLCELVRELLGVDVNPDDGFFALGGDSIRSIQLVSRARAAGLEITPADVFAYRTITALAAAARTGESVAADNGVGRARLTPVMHQLRELGGGAIDGFSQTVVVRAPADLDRAWLTRALQALVNHHDVLRARLTDDWELEIAPPGAVNVLSIMDTGEELAEAVRSAADHARSRLAPREGKVLHAVWLPSVERLVLSVHHLAVDGYSWRVLLPDLAAAYAGAELEPVRTSFRRWAELLGEQVPRRRRELPLWQRVLDGDVGGEPLDPELDTVGTAGSLRVELDIATTSQEILLSAFGEAIARWNGRSSVLVELEGHGREHLASDVDVSRTVGWFTSSYPVRVEIGKPVMSPPDHGIGFGVLRYLAAEPELAVQPPPRIGFNYLGRFEHGENADWAPTEENALTGHGADDAMPLQHVLAVDAVTEGRRLAVTWTWASRLVSRQDVEEITATWARLLAERPERTESQLALDPVLRISDTGSEEPLFCLHGGVGLAWPYMGLAAYVEDRPVIGLQAGGILSPGAPADELGELAETYLEHIVALQPLGPYHLLGWSFGGYLAHEIAVRLQERGEEVALLAVLDTYPVGRADTELPPDHELLAQLLEYLGHDSARFAGRSVAEILAEVADDDAKLAGLGEQEFTNLVDVMRLHGRLGPAFTPRKFTGRMLHFSATVDSGGADAARHAWQAHVLGDVVCHEIDCEHELMMTPEPLAAIGPVIAAELRGERGEPGAGQ